MAICEFSVKTLTPPINEDRQLDTMPKFVFFKLSKSFRKIAIIRFSRWRPNAILDLLHARVEQQLRVLGGFMVVQNFVE